MSNASAIDKEIETMKTSVKKNYIYSVAYQVLSFLTPIITIPHVSRVFGAEYLGIYSYTNTVAQYFVLFALLGLLNYGNRSIAMVRDDPEKLNQTFSDIFTMQILTGTLSLIAYLIYCFVFSGELQLYSLILILYVISGLFDINWLFFGLEKFRLTVTRNSVIKLATVISILVFVRSKEDLWLYTTIFSAGMLLSVLALWPYAFKEIRFVKPSLKGVMGHFKPNLIMFIPVVAISVFKYMDKIMLGGFSKTEVGYYENVEKIFTVAMGFITAFGTVMLPRMSNIAAKGNVEVAEKTIRSSMRFVIGLAFAMTFGIAAVSKEFVHVYFGEGFDPCVLIMISLTPTIAFQSWANVIRTQYLIPFHHDKAYVISVIIGAVINFSLNYLLIPAYGAIGAVIGTVAAEICVAVYQTIESRKELNILKYIIEGLPFMLFGFIMYIVVRMINRIDITSDVLKLIMEIVVGAFVYLVLWGGYELIMRKKSGDYFWLMKYRIKKTLTPSRIRSKEFIQYLRYNKINVGKGTFFFDPASTTVDIQRPWMLHIGEYCKITQNCTILTHDYSRSVLRRVYGEIIGEAEETYIGNNVFIGLNSVVCMGAHIGDNVIIGAGSIVKGNIPDNTVAAGNPARVLCTLEEYYKKRKERYVDEGLLYAKRFHDFFGRKPTEQEMGPFFPLFLERDVGVLRNKKIFTHLSGDDEDSIIEYFLRTSPDFESYESFLDKSLSMD